MSLQVNSMYNPHMTVNILSAFRKAVKSLLRLYKCRQQHAVRKIIVPSLDHDRLLKPEEIIFLICVEANRLEPQALLLCSSIRRYAGRYQNVPIVAVSPRPQLALSAESRKKLEALGVSYVSAPLNNTGSTYGTINRIVTGAWAEANLTQPYIVVLDTDMIFVSEPDFVRADAGVRPVDVKGSATAGDHDVLNQYWNRLCTIAGIKLSQLPMLETTVDQVAIRASYNGGFSVVKRDLGILQRTKDIFFASMQENLRPLAGSNMNVMASTGFVGTEASEWWGSSQAALSIAIWSTTSDVYVYDNRYNIPAHILVKPEIAWPLSLHAPPALLHIHYLAEPQYREQFHQVIQRLDCTQDVADWIEERLIEFDHHNNANVCLCTLAIHEPYRQRARVLCNDAPNLAWVVLTDEPADFSDLPVRAIAHRPTGPMAVDYLSRIPPTGENRGAAAYHDKRFALMGALEQHQTAIFLDADSRINCKPRLDTFPTGISVLPVVRRNIMEHLQTAGTWRLPAFVALAEHLTGSADILQEAHWCQESCIAITKDGREEKFFETWGCAAAFMQEREVFSGEGGCIGLAAAIAGWTVNYDAVTSFGATLVHEGGGPKDK